MGLCCYLPGAKIWWQVRWSGIPITFRIFHSLWWSTQFKGFGIVNKAQIDVFLELSSFFDDPADVGNLISGSPAFSKSSLNIWKFTVHALLKPGLENLSITLLACEMSVVVWTFFGIAFLWGWNENWPFPVLWPLLCFPNLLTYWVQHLHSSLEGFMIFQRCFEPVLWSTFWVELWVLIPGTCECEGLECVDRGSSVM